MYNNKFLLDFPNFIWSQLSFLISSPVFLVSVIEGLKDTVWTIDAKPCLVPNIDQSTATVWTHLTEEFE